MNLLEAKRKSLSLMAEYSTDGVIIPDGENADYLNRMNRFADTSQKEIATVKKIPATHTFSQKPIPNQLGLLYAMEIKQKLKDDVIETAPGSRAYYFEVDNIATIYVEENVGGGWQRIAEMSNTSKKQYTAFKGLISPINPGNQIRLRFTGPYPYNIRNRALYEFPFPTADDIPVYQRYVEYDMPTDFYELKKVMLTTDPITYNPTSDYFWKNRRTLKTNYFISGEWEVHYYRYPTTIDANTPDTYEFEIDIEAQEALPFFLAGMAIYSENQVIGTQLLNEYQLKLSRLYMPENVQNTAITELYSM